jgi:hypothetical protein
MAAIKSTEPSKEEVPLEDARAAIAMFGRVSALGLAFTIIVLLSILVCELPKVAAGHYQVFEKTFVYAGVVIMTINFIWFLVATTSEISVYFIRRIRRLEHRNAHSLRQDSDF